LGRSRLILLSPMLISATVLFKAIGTNNLQQRKTRILPRHLQTAEIDGTLIVLTSASSVYQSSASVASGGMQTTLVYSSHRGIKYL
jgi:hypothetical protein